MMRAIFKIYRYVSYAKDGGLWIAQLSHDAKTEVKSERIYTPPKEIGYLEGTRMYKRNGQYYIFTDHPSIGQYILKAGHPFGPYTVHQVFQYCTVYSLRACKSKW